MLFLARGGTPVTTFWLWFGFPGRVDACYNAGLRQFRCVIIDTMLRHFHAAQDIRIYDAPTLRDGTSKF
jgi:hypothetical protein